MPKKLTYEYVKEYIESFSGYKLLSKEYINANAKLKIICPLGHNYKVKWNKWQQGTRCPICSGVVKYTIKDIENMLIKEGYKLLSDEYINAHSYISISCKLGHEYETTWNNFQQGSRCPICSGNKKLTYKYVKEQIEKEGYKLLSNEYTNSKTKLKMICNKRHEFSATFDSWRAGSRCPVCAGNIRIPFEEVKNMFENEGYKVLTKEEEYSGIWKTKIKYICNNGHKGSMLGSNFRKGHRCQQCTQLPFEHILESFNEAGYEVLTKKEDFINTYKTKIEYKCPEGHIYKVGWNNWKNGTRCPKCGGYIVEYDEVKDMVEEAGYEMISKEYVNCQTKFTVKCDKGHEYEVTKNNFKTGRRCPICNGFSTTKLTYQFVKEQIEKEGYKLLSKRYKNNMTLISIQCDKGHKYYGKYAYFQQGSRCPICNNLSKSSKGEREVCEYVKSLIKEEVIPNDRTQIVNTLTGHNLELDVWIPSINKAIEYNGMHWHNNEYQKYKDEEKVKQCKEKNIDLMIIWENDWKNSKEQCKNNIKQFLKN